MIDLISYSCIGLGLVFWLWGTWPLLGPRSVLFKLHSLSVADTLGSMSIVVGLLLKIPNEWPLLILALISLAIWNTVLGYVLAYCSSDIVHLAPPTHSSSVSAGDAPYV
ncbi:monovalent cation/H(+) antiporter subunit G [Trichothermofontia sichuanensis B231]|uniref:monovalent cation/H(+) antiporter subunit G n=1 Tax=Trichothermofontia sichuanensis TaxID=3045816 RepID=UPI0022473A35|nr:monovalent cation/H(+) antiporter subunit G [Trichothermofontia sichuanensis]UZQ54766.1 monovalent cation/H(+) antiporter subunit G [Trichothermofontia sichuanensis B231]